MNAAFADAPPGFKSVFEIAGGGPVRRDFGDLKPLMASMDQVGQRHPIGLTSLDEVLFGARRLEAAKQLGWRVVKVVQPVSREEALAVLKAEDDVCRVPMLPSEIAEMGRRLEELRMAPWKGHRRLYRKPELSAERDIHRHAMSTELAAALRVSRGTYERIRAVVNTADGTTQATDDLRVYAQDLLERMDRGAVSIYAAVVQLRQAKKHPPLTEPLPEKVGPRPNHSKILGNVANSLSGLAIVLNDIEELADTVTAEEAGRIASDLSKSIRAVNRIKQNLRARSLHQ